MVFCLMMARWFQTKNFHLFHLYDWLKMREMILTSFKTISKYKKNVILKQKAKGSLEAGDQAKK